MEATTVQPSNKVPAGYWIVAVIATLWMLAGVFAWVMDLTMDATALDQMSDGQRQLYESRPQWLFVDYAVAVFSGLVGAIGLLMRKAWAKLAFAISLVAIIVQFGYMFTAMDAIGHVGAAAALPFPIVIFALGVIVLWFSLLSIKRGWIR